VAPRTSQPSVPNVAANDDPEAVRRELLYLRKGPGYSDERLGACTALVQVLGGASEPVEVLRERLESAIHSLHDPDEELLWGVYGFEGGVGTGTLTARRDAIARRLGISREAVADRDTRAVERLLHQLITGWYPKSPIGIRIPESHNGIVQHHVHVATVVNNRKHELTHHRYRFMATFDGADYLTVAADHEGLVSVTQGDFTIRALTVERGTLYQFWHAEPLRRGKVYDLGFLVRNPDMANDHYWLTEQSIAFHEPTRHATFEVRFKGEEPDTTWGFADLTAADRPSLPTAGKLIPLLRGQRAHFSATDLHGGLYAGMAWRWGAK
jgi:hypothetical protein